VNFCDLQLQLSYETGKHDLVGDFYVPVLSCAKRYDRIAGFFSSTSLAIAARGLAGLIERRGKMRLITCQRLNQEDYKMIETSVTDVRSIIAKNFIEETSRIIDQFEKDHIEALGWMLANGYLEMKIALVYNKGRLCTFDEIDKKSIMHQKVGIVYDDDFNALSFSGSNNESASGWLNNIEEFKVFKDWELGQKEYFKSDQKKFEEFWTNNREGVKIIDLPKAIEEQLVEIGVNFNADKIALYKYFSMPNKENKKIELKLFFYQKDAVNMWLENDKKLMLEMATGCGKTRTAIGCIKEVLKESKTPVIVVACPQNTLALQWKQDIDNLDINIDQSIIVDGTIPKWKDVLAKNMSQLTTGYHDNLIIYTTHQTSSSEGFIDVMENTSSRLNRFFIGDEAHGLGAGKTQNALLENYNYRLGLSATPRRWFDERGTVSLYSYFGDKTFEFTIEDALSTINPVTGKPFLVNFYYNPNFISLTEEELNKYHGLSDRITKMSRMKDSNDEYNKKLEFLLFERANIEKNAENKYSELESILDKIASKEQIQDTIIFVSYDQINRVMQILGKRLIKSHRFTQEEGTNKILKYGNISEREHLIRLFKKGEYHVLVAIKCLDEGIDIPSAKRAIIMASSTNPREYVQRIGRIIRQADQKYEADIYDLIIKPDTSYFVDEQLAELEKRIFAKEMDRVKDLSKNALNNAIVSKKIYEILGRL
jgi:superfamily II DNA or RNA helicase